MLTRLICDECGKRLWADPAESTRCTECQGQLRKMGPLESFVDRWFAPPDLGASDLQRRHLQLIELLWTADGRGRELYEIVKPRKVSYSAFVARVNSVVCRGLEEGWIEATIPRAPAPNDSAYSLTIKDTDRFADEIGRLFAPPAGSMPGPENVPFEA